jgi:hypothetical protein
MFETLAYKALVTGGIPSPSLPQIEILAKIIEKYVEQQLKGLAKYQKAIDPTDPYDWLEMAMEEQIDLTVYQICELQRIQGKREQLNRQE